MFQFQQIAESFSKLLKVLSASHMSPHILHTKFHSQSFSNSLKVLSAICQQFAESAFSNQIALSAICWKCLHQMRLQNHMWHSLESRMLEFGESWRKNRNTPTVSWLCSRKLSTYRSRFLAVRMVLCFPLGTILLILAKAVDTQPTRCDIATQFSHDSESGDARGVKKLLRAEAVRLCKMSWVHRQRNGLESQFDSLKLALRSVRALPCLIHQWMPWNVGFKTTSALAGSV